uniref:tautomerase family protein n=1 Tax=Duodenibacillus massiliensis TaxID=1852381 RepID=UPI00307AEB4D
MPLVVIKVTGGNEAPTVEQKKELIAGATDLLVRVLGKNPATTSVIIEEVPPENWGIGGLNTPERRKREAGKRKRPEARSICAGFPRFFAKRWRSPVEK